MSITDELREWVTHHYTGWESKRAEGYAIADRIDAAHEDALVSSYFDGVFSDEELAENGFIRLPVDADGEYIRVGDVVEWVPYDNTYPSVVRKVNAVGNGVFFAWDKANGRFAQYEAHAYRHHKQQTVEDVLRELEGMRGNGADYEDVVTRCAELAKTLRELLAVSANE